MKLYIIALAIFLVLVLNMNDAQAQGRGRGRGRGSRCNDFNDDDDCDSGLDFSPCEADDSCGAICVGGECNALDSRGSTPWCRGKLTIPSGSRIWLTKNGRPGNGKVRKVLGFRSRARTSGPVKLDGNCCAKIYSRKRYRGTVQKLDVGHSGPINFKFRSLKFGVCNDL